MFSNTFTNGQTRCNFFICIFTFFKKCTKKKKAYLFYLFRNLLSCTSLNTFSWYFSQSYTFLRNVEFFICLSGETQVYYSYKDICLFGLFCLFSQRQLKYRYITNNVYQEKKVLSYDLLAPSHTPVLHVRVYAHRLNCL